jgi:hypothetical protein
MLQTGRLDGARANEFLQPVEANGFAHIELQQYQHRSAQYGFSGLNLKIRHDGLILTCKHESFNNDKLAGRQRSRLALWPGISLI